jgi:hypothetical protein
MDEKKIKHIIFREVLILLGFAAVPYIYFNCHPVPILSIEPDSIGRFLARNSINLGYPIYLLIRAIIWGVRKLRGKK